ncbi:hypothetical protein ACOMHN_036592 [Nucella lapillus]
MPLRASHHSQREETSLLYYAAQSQPSLPERGDQPALLCRSEPAITPRERRPACSIMPLRASHHSQREETSLLYYAAQSQPSLPERGDQPALLCRSEPAITPRERRPACSIMPLRASHHSQREETSLLYYAAQSQPSLPERGDQPALLCRSEPAITPRERRPACSIMPLRASHHSQREETSLLYYAAQSQPSLPERGDQPALLCRSSSHPFLCPQKAITISLTRPVLGDS